MCPPSPPLPCDLPGLAHGRPPVVGIANHGVACRCVSSAAGLCPLLCWNKTGTVLAVLNLGLESVTLWRRPVVGGSARERDGAQLRMRVALDFMPTCIWWSNADVEVRACVRSDHRGGGVVSVV